MFNTLANVIVAIAKTVKYIINIILITATFIVVIWVLNLAHLGVRDMFFSTKETRYETQLVHKAHQLLGIMLPKESYLVFASVTFRDKQEKIQQIVKNPKEMDTSVNTDITIEHVSEPKQSKVETEQNDLIQLPGMQHLITTRNPILIQQSMSHQETMSESKSTKQIQKTVYFDEKNIEVSYTDNSITSIKVTVLIDPVVFKDNQLTSDSIQTTLLDVLPLNLSRGDSIVVNTQAISQKPSFFDHIISFSKQVYITAVKYVINPIMIILIKLASYWKWIATIIAIIAAVPIVRFLYRQLVSFICYIRQLQLEKRLKQEEKEKQQEAENAKHVINHLDENGQLKSYPAGVLNAVKVKKKESVEVLKYWMGFDNNG